MVEEPPKPPSTFNRKLDSDLAIICLKCLEKDPAHRYSSALALAEDLERWSRCEPIEARPIRRAEKFWRWCHRQPVLAALTGAVGLLLLATSVFALLAYRVTKRGLEAEQKRGEAAAKEFWERVDREWEDPERRYVHLKAVEMGVMSGHPITPDVNETEIKVGVQLPGKDRSDPQMRIAIGHPALAYYLRTNLAPRAVLCDVFIYKSSSNAVEAVLRGEVDVMQLSPAAYVEARRRDASIIPLVAQTHEGKAGLYGAIFAHTNSGIGGLEELRGRTFIFAERDSAIGYHLPKLELMNAGLRARDLIGWTNTRSWHAIRLVREGQFAAGAADLADVAKLVAAGAPLRVLDTVQSQLAVGRLAKNGSCPPRCHPTEPPFPDGQYNPGRNQPRAYGVQPYHRRRLRRTGGATG